MVHRISAGALTLFDERILLVHHYRAGIHDFWAAPGGGVEGNETLEACAIRETLEETGISIKIERMAYIDELWSEADRTLKFWFLAHYISGDIDIGANPAIGESISEANWFALDDLPSGDVFPEPIPTHFNADRVSGFQVPMRLPLRRLRF